MIDLMFTSRLRQSPGRQRAARGAIPTGRRVAAARERRSFPRRALERFA
jgi:hypothetical protein